MIDNGHLQYHTVCEYVHGKKYFSDPIRTLTCTHGIEKGSDHGLNANQIAVTRKWGDFKLEYHAQSLDFYRFGVK